MQEVRCAVTRSADSFNLSTVKPIRRNLNTAIRLNAFKKKPSCRAILVADSSQIPTLLIRNISGLIFAIA
jgi:hypothetical protein